MKILGFFFVCFFFALVFYALISFIRFVCLRFKAFVIRRKLSKVAHSDKKLDSENKDD